MTTLLQERITAYLSGGGLFNPEMAIHTAVRDLLIDCRAALAAEPIGFTGYQYQGRTGQWNDFSNEGQYKAAVSIGARPIRVKPCPACGKSLGSAGDIHTCSPQEKN